jgi:hypothetical protein
MSKLKSIYHDIALQVGGSHYPEVGGELLSRFADELVRRCAEMNKQQMYELTGVIIDSTDGEGFDEVCLNTVKRVESYLANGLENHFEVK